MALVDEIRELRDEVRALNRLGETYKLEIQKHEEQLNGNQGVFSAMEKLSAKLDGLTKAAYSVGVALIVSSVGFAFSVLTLIH